MFTDTYNEMLGILMARTPATDKEGRSLYMNTMRDILHGYNPFWAAHVLTRMYEHNLLSLELPEMNFSGNDYDTSNYVITDGGGNTVGSLVMNNSGTPTYGSAEVFPAGGFANKYTVGLSEADTQRFVTLQTGTETVGVSVTRYTGDEEGYRYYSVSWPEQTGLSGNLKVAEGCPDIVYIFVNTKYPEEAVVERATRDSLVIDGLIDARLLEEFSLSHNVSEKIGLLGLAVYRLWEAETSKR